jgi:hypothetical protein
MADETPDLLFVFAGAQHRKEFALAAWRTGAARTLGIAVARFEWRRVPGLALPGDGGLLGLVEATPPRERLFVLLLDADRVEARRVPKGRWGTWSEAKALAAIARERGVGGIVVCTSGYHLPRAILAVRRALAASGVKECMVTSLAAEEPESSPLAPRARWRSPVAWLRLLGESGKWLVYAAGVPMALDPPRPGS